MAQIELSAIRKSFDGTDVLKGIDFRIEDGEFISLVGPSGCQGYRIWPIACKRKASSQPARLILRRIEA